MNSVAKVDISIAPATDLELFTRHAPAAPSSNLESVTKPHAPFLFLFAHVTAQRQPGNMLVSYIGFGVGFLRVDTFGHGPADKFQAQAAWPCLRCAPIPGAAEPTIGSQAIAFRNTKVATRSSSSTATTTKTR